MMDIASTPMRHTFLSRFAFLPLVLATLLTSACAADPTAPTPEPLEQALEVYAGPLDPGGLTTYLFTTARPGSIQLMLAGVVLGDPLRSISPTLRLQIARWNGTECETVTSIDTAPRMTAALHAYIEPATYCAIVSDAVGTLTEPVGVTLRLAAPALLSTGDEPGTATFTNTITPRGSASRTFVASTQGVTSIALTSLSAADVEVGLGVGVLPLDGSGCRLTQIVRAVAGVSPPFTVRVDAGPYCAVVFDLGNFTKNETFSLTITHP